MINFKRILIIMLIMCISCIRTVCALSQQKNELLNKFPPALKTEYTQEPFVITDSWFDEAGNPPEVEYYSTIYSKITTYYSALNNPISKEEQISKEEYDNINTRFDVGNCENAGLAADCWETTGKRVRLFVLTYDSSSHEARRNVKVLVMNEWKTIPYIKSYDTIGLMYSDFTMDTAYGYQIYNTASNTSHQQVSYSYNGTNMKIATKGVSISQNIVDSTYNFLQNELWVEGKLDNDLHGRFTASYQHAVTDITLYTSKNFNFSGTGMGKVFAWNTSYSNWDGMQGLCYNQSPYLWLC